MHTLYFGPNNALNKAVVSSLIASEKHMLTWVVPESETNQLPDTAEIEVIDVSSFDSLAQALKIELADKEPFSRIVFAEGTGGVRPVKLNSESFVDEMFRKNVFSFFEFVRSLLKAKSIASGASIVALSSVSSIKGLKSKSVYSASKAALDAAVRGMAAELAPKKIRINSIQKGWVDVDMELDFIKDNMSLSGGSDFSEQPLGAIPAEELGRLIRFLLSDEVTTMTGVNLVLDGGYTL